MFEDDPFKADHLLIRDCYKQQGVDYDVGLKHFRKKQFWWYKKHEERINIARANFQYTVSARRRGLTVWEMLRERIEAKIR